MFIKQLTIHGFKSYKDQTVIGPFNPKHNVIVGRNGSGKSNFFAAIRFVLNDAYTKLGPEERQSLLHEGGGAQNMAGYVEIVFDNTDNRLPTGRDVVTIRRTIGLKKDEYSLDRKPATKTDIQALLQAAGFSKSNPYFIVPQGRITALTNAKDAERLQLLKEVAGTRVYEDHRAESLKIMEETDTKRDKIVELLKIITERLEELEEEKEELRQFQELDRRKRACEYLLHHREQVEAIEGLEALEEDNRHLIDSNSETRKAFEDDLDQITQMESELLELKKSLEEAEGERLQLEADRAEHLKAKTQLELSIADIQKDSGRHQRDEKLMRKALDEVEQEIGRKEQELSGHAAQIDELQPREEQLKARIAQLASQHDVLVSKQGRFAQFRSAADRDRWIRKEVDAMKQALDLQTRQLSNLGDEVKTCEVREGDLSRLIGSLSGSQSNYTEQIQKLDAEYQQSRQRRDAATESKKGLWRAEAKLEAALGTIRDEIQKTERSLFSTMDRGVLQGLESVRRITRRLNLTGVYGPLYELFTVDDVFCCATDVVGGQSLFDVVVENDSIASSILEVMLKEKSGRVTFMPLNRIRPPAASYPQMEEVVPLISQLTYDPKFEAAMRQVFGKAVVCQNLSVASSIARSHKLNAITLNGDRVDRKGALTGGYIDNRKSRLETIGKLKMWRAKEAEHQKLIADVQSRVKLAEQQVTRALADLETIECRKKEISSGHSSARTELELRRKELIAQRQILAAKRAAAQQLKGAIQAAVEQARSLEAELGTPFAEGLSAPEQATLRSLTGEIDGLRSELVKLSLQISSVTTAKATLESELDDRLRKRRHDMLLQLAQMASARSTAKIGSFQSSLTDASASLKQLDAEKASVDRTAEKLLQEMRNLAASIEKSKTLYDEQSRKVGQQNQHLEKYMSKRSVLVQRREECARKIRDLGVISEELYDQLCPSPTPLLLRTLHQVNDELKAYVHVNKKAYEQYASFTKQGETLCKRQEELDQSATAITDFVRVLDQRKDEAIERTFQQVARNFGEVFEKLVPSGRGALVMLRSSDPRAESDADSDGGSDEAEEGLPASTIKYTGIAIRVSFNSKAEEGLMMSQLSGGQKSLVALALIFAIQKCDPAPFYLFDEVDANLDAAHRTAVAALIHEMSSSPKDLEGGEGAVRVTPQFITTTFRPELLTNADAFFGVTFGHRVSRVEVISKESAMDFIVNEPAAGR